MPLILVTNDDGVHATGLEALVAALVDIAEVVVVAPTRQQSATSHGITLDRPLRVRHLGEGRIAVTGTPTDAVMLAIHRLLPRRPDLIVSGINHGLNIGSDIFYSGTVAAALEGAMKGVPALAVSQDLPGAHDGAPTLDELFAQVARFAALVAARVLERPLPTGVTLNINAPSRLASRYMWTRVGERVYSGDVVERVDPRGAPYYWFGGAACEPDGPVGTDSRAIRDGLLSISPLSPDWNTERPEEVVGWALDGFRGA